MLQVENGEQPAEAAVDRRGGLAGELLRHDGFEQVKKQLGITARFERRAGEDAREARVPLRQIGDGPGHSAGAGASSSLMRRLR